MGLGPDCIVLTELNLNAADAADIEFSADYDVKQSLARDATPIKNFDPHSSAHYATLVFHYDSSDIFDNVDGLDCVYTSTDHFYPFGNTEQTDLDSR